MNIKRILAMGLCMVSFFGMVGCSEATESTSKPKFEYVETGEEIAGLTAEEINANLGLVVDEDKRATSSSNVNDNFIANKEIIRIESVKSGSNQLKIISSDDKWDNIYSFNMEDSNMLIERITFPDGGRVNETLVDKEKNFINGKYMQGYTMSINGLDIKLYNQERKVFITKAGKEYKFQLDDAANWFLRDSENKVQYHILHEIAGRKDDMLTISTGEVKSDITLEDMVIIGLAVGEMCFTNSDSNSN